MQPMDKKALSIKIGAHAAQSKWSVCHTACHDGDRYFVTFIQHITTGYFSRQAAKAPCSKHFSGCSTSIVTHTGHFGLPRLLSQSYQPQRYPFVKALPCTLYGNNFFWLHMMKAPKKNMY
jgi:hypothetical protein